VRGKCEYQDPRRNLKSNSRCRDWLVAICRTQKSEERQHSEVGDVGEEEEDEELSRRGLQSRHEVEDQLREEIGVSSRSFNFTAASALYASD
jgi:hypothetical protein